jgi:hypothetical protein
MPPRGSATELEDSRYRSECTHGSEGDLGDLRWGNELVIQGSSDLSIHKGGVPLMSLIEMAQLAFHSNFRVRGG